MAEILFDSFTCGMFGLNLGFAVKGSLMNYFGATMMLPFMVCILKKYWVNK